MRSGDDDDPNSNHDAPAPEIVEPQLESEVDDNSENEDHENGHQMNDQNDTQPNDSHAPLAQALQTLFPRPTSEIPRSPAQAPPILGAQSKADDPEISPVAQEQERDNNREKKKDNKVEEEEKEKTRDNNKVVEEKTIENKEKPPVPITPDNVHIQDSPRRGLVLNQETTPQQPLSFQDQDTSPAFYTPPQVLPNPRPFPNIRFNPIDDVRFYDRDYDPTNDESTLLPAIEAPATRSRGSVPELPHVLRAPIERSTMMKREIREAHQQHDQQKLAKQMDKTDSTEEEN